MAKQYTEKDYEKILDMYNSYQSNKDKYDAEKQKQIDDMFGKIVNDIAINTKQQQQENPNPIIEGYGGYGADEGAVYQVRKNGDTEQVLKNYNDMADEVIAGKWGVGDARKKALTDAGYNYSKIQEIVNQKLKKPKKETPKIELQYIPPEDKGALVGAGAVAEMPQYPQFPAISL